MGTANILQDIKCSGNGEWWWLYKKMYVLSQAPVAHA
jgi:hypothetical protein